MDTMTIGEFKSRFASVLERIKRGDQIVISYGRKKEKVAVLVPYKNYRGGMKKRKLGILSRRAGYSLHHFSLSDEDFLAS